MREGSGAKLRAQPPSPDFLVLKGVKNKLAVPLVVPSGAGLLWDYYGTTISSPVGLLISSPQPMGLLISSPVGLLISSPGPITNYAIKYNKKWQ